MIKPYTTEDVICALENLGEEKSTVVAVLTSDLALFSIKAKLLGSMVYLVMDLLAKEFL